MHADFFIRTYFLLAFWLVLGTPMVVECQIPDASVKSFNSDDGLYSSDFKQVLEDQSGFVWIKYGFGLQRFDGKHTVDYFKGVEVHSMVLDDEGIVWISTDDGVFRYQRDSGGFHQIFIGEAISVPILLFCIEDLPVFFWSQTGIFSYDVNKDTFKHSQYLLTDHSGDYIYRSTNFDNDGFTLFYSSRDSVWCHNLLTGERKATKIEEVGWVHAISDDEIIATNWQAKSWYYNFSTGEKVQLTLPGTDSYLYIHDIFTSPRGITFLASSKGLLSFDVSSKGISQLVLSSYGLPFPERIFRAVAFHKNGHIWAATDNSLLLINHAHEQIHFIRDNPLDCVRQFDNRVRNFATGGENNLWLATGDGLTRWNLSENTFVTLEAKDGNQNGLNHASIRGLVFDGTNLIIGQTNKGIWLYNPTTKIFKRPTFTKDKLGELTKEKLEQDFINQIRTLRNGDHVISARDGVYVMDKLSYTIREIHFLGSTKNIVFSYEDSKGNVFIGSLEGLYCLKSDFSYDFEVTAQIEGRSTYCILEFGNGYYLGTRQGLYFFSKGEGTVTVKKVILDLSESRINSLFKDESGFIWIVTDGALCRLDKDGQNLTVFGSSENIHTDYFYPNSYYKRDDGLVFLGGMSGINYFYPEKIKGLNDTLKPYIRQIQLLSDTQEITRNPVLNLPYNERSLSVHFATPYFGNPSDLQYRYKLKEQGSWYDVGNSSNIILWQLSPGTYQFRLSVSLGSNDWFASDEVFHFEIAYPFWQRWWFILIILCLLAFIGFAYYRSTQRKITTEQMLSTFATSLYGQNTVDAILWDTARNCVQKMGFMEAAIYQVDFERELVLQKVAIGKKQSESNRLSDGEEQKIEQDLIDGVVKTGKAKIASMDKWLPNVQGVNSNVRSRIAVPILIEGEVFAVVYAGLKEKYFFKSYHLALLEKVAGISAQRLVKYLSEEQLRGKIARDLHDDMGSTLTSIQIISKMAGQDAKENPIAQKHFYQINKHTTGIMDRMSDLVWVVNPANDSLDKVIYRIKEYAVEMMEPLGIELNFTHMNYAENIKLNPDERKNIFLIAKESIHNAVKYSQSEKIWITFKEEENVLEMIIADSGKGFKIHDAKPGNGLTNMANRAKEVKADFNIKTEIGKGVSISIKLKVVKITSDEA